MTRNLRQQVNDIRAEIESEKAERDSVASLPATPEEVAANVEAWIGAKAAHWAPAIGALVRPGESTRDFTLALPLVNVNVGPSSVESQREAALCALFPDRIRDVLLERCEKHLAEHGSGLPLAERIARLAALDHQIAELEQREESLIVAAEADGIEIDRRPDADPRVVFAIQEIEGGATPPGDTAKGAARPRSTREARPVAESTDFGAPPEAA